MLGKITRPQHVYKVSEGLKAPYRHIRDIVFHSFNIVFHRYVENSYTFKNTFINHFNILLSLYCTFRHKKRPLRWDLFTDSEMRMFRLNELLDYLNLQFR